MFKVVPDQLRISEGWVRCGQCDEIFDASLHLLQVAPDEGPPAAEHEGLAANYDVTDVSDASAPPVDIALDLGAEVSSNECPSAQDQVLPEALDAVAEQSLPGPISLAPSSAAPHDHLAHADYDDSEPDLTAELSDVSFLRDKRGGSFWRRPLMRATLVMLSFALLLGLAGQIVFHERDRIAASEPRLKPWLLTICGLLNCTLAPLRRIESMVIDSSSFTKIRGDSYRLNFTLKNTAVTALATPAIELTLTDSHDQPVVRRVFFPSELGVKLETLAAGSEWPTSIALAVKAPGIGDRVAGYRLLVFYP